MCLRWVSSSSCSLPGAEGAGPASLLVCGSVTRSKWFVLELDKVALSQIFFVSEGWAGLPRGAPKNPLSLVSLRVHGLTPTPIFQRNRPWPVTIGRNTTPTTPSLPRRSAVQAGTRPVGAWSVRAVYRRATARTLTTRTAILMTMPGAICVFRANRKTAPAIVCWGAGRVFWEVSNGFEE